MKTIASRSQYLDDQIACIIDSLIFGHLQRKQYSKTLHALLLESPHLTKDVTTLPNAPNQIVLNVNGFLHDQNLEQIIQSFYTYGRFDVSPNLLELGKKLRDLTNEFSSELAFGCHSYSNNAQRLYGRKLRMRAQQNPTVMNQVPLDYQFDNNKRTEFSMEPVPRSLNETHNNDVDLHYSHVMESDETRAADSSSHENTHHSRRKTTQPLKQSQRVMQYVETHLVKLSNDLRDKDTGVDSSSFLIDPFLDSDNLNDILRSVVDGETLYETLESVEREDAIEADMNSRDSMNHSSGVLALDIPMHDDYVPPSSSALSPLHNQPPSSSSHPRNSFSMPPPPRPPSQIGSTSLNRNVLRPLMEQYIEHPSISNSVDNREYAGSCAPNFLSPPPPPADTPALECAAKAAVAEPRGDVRESVWSRSGVPTSQTKTRLPPPPHTASPIPPPSTTSSSTTLGTSVKMSSFGRIPKKVHSNALSVTPLSPSASPKTTQSHSEADPSKDSEGIRVSKGKVAPSINVNNGGRKDSVDSQDTLRAESVGESDCTMTENEDNDHPVRKESGKCEKKASWDDLFDDSPSTLEEANREREKQKEAHENKRRMEMRELEKKKEREKRRKEKEKKEDDRRDRSRDDKNRHEKRSVEERRRDCGRDEKEEREKEKEKEKDDRQRRRREQEEQKRIIEEQKRQMENEERARQKKKEEEERKREVREKEEEKRKEKEKEAKKLEDEKMRKERETKAKEERRNELERRRRREAQQRKIIEKPPILLGDSPLDKIAAEMDGKELRKENEFETATRTSSRVMDISSGLERLRPSSLLGSLHSSKSGIFLDKAQKLRETTGRQKVPPEMRRPVRPNRVQMAPMKRPPPAAMLTDEEEEEEEGEKSPREKRGKLEDTKIDHILNKLYR